MIRRARASVLVAPLVLLAISEPPPHAAERIASGEAVIFFNTFASRVPDGAAWLARIHAWLFKEGEPGGDPDAGLLRFQRALGLEPVGLESAHFRERARPFLFHSERGRVLSIVVNDAVLRVGTTAGSGHVETTLRVPDGVIRRGKNDAGWVPFGALVPEGDPRIFQGAFQAIEETGISVISDIDDTVKVSQVANRKELLANTFLREYRPVSGMSEAYRRWARGGAVLHYVSGSPWQLYAPLVQFLRLNGFPEGSVHLRPFRWKDASVANLVASPERTKPAAIQPILDAFPRRRFVLVGDSGEKDPEIYGALARRHPKQVAAIWIRYLGAEDAGAERVVRAFAGVPRDRWGLFHAGEELPPDPVHRAP